MMYGHQRHVGEETVSKEILKTIGYVLSLNKSYFKAKDLTNMLGVKPKGRHKLSWSLKTLVDHKLIEIYHKNSRNLYHIPFEKRLLDTYHENLWNHVQSPNRRETQRNCSFSE